MMVLFQARLEHMRSKHSNLSHGTRREGGAELETPVLMMNGAHSP